MLATMAEGRHGRRRAGQLRRVAWALASGSTLALCGSCNDAVRPLPDRCFVSISTVTPFSTTLAVGDTARFTIAYNPVSADCLPSVPASQLAWRSGNATIATVDSALGRVTARAVGTTVVSAYVPNTAVLGGSGFVIVVAP
jgi:hypothetical protein